MSKYEVHNCDLMVNRSSSYMVSSFASQLGLAAALLKTYVTC